MRHMARVLVGLLASVAAGCDGKSGPLRGEIEAASAYGKPFARADVKLLQDWLARHGKGWNDVVLRSHRLGWVNIETTSGRYTLAYAPETCRVTFQPRKNLLVAIEAPDHRYLTQSIPQADTGPLFVLASHYFRYVPC